MEYFLLSTDLCLSLFHCTRHAGHPVQRERSQLAPGLDRPGAVGGGQTEADALLAEEEGGGGRRQQARVRGAASAGGGRQVASGGHRVSNIC